MKRCVSATLILIILFILNACKSDSLQTDSSGATPSTKPSAEESVGPNMSISEVTFDSFETICEWSNAIVKAKYVGYEDFEPSVNIYKFEVETDFTDTVDEEIIHVYENAYSSFIEGKSYYLFLSGRIQSLYPHTTYARVCSQFFLGEISMDDQIEYTFYNDYGLDAADIKDMSSYIETEIIQKGKYIQNPEKLIHESVESAYDNADCILLVTVTEIIPENKYISVFIGNIDEDIVHVYENALTSFSEGKTYFLFLCGFRHALYPHIIFTRTCPEFLLGEINAEDGTGYTFYNEYSLDVQNVQDFSKYIKTEIIKSGSYMNSPDYMTHESYEDAYGNADAVLLVTVTDVEANNKYTSFCHYKIDRVLKGVYTDNTLSKEEYDKILNSENGDKILDAAGVGEETEYLPGSVVSLSTEVGDQIIFLYRYDPELERFDIYSGENFQFPIDSDGGKYILDTASKDAAFK